MTESSITEARLDSTKSHETDEEEDDAPVETILQAPNGMSAPAKKKKKKRKAKAPAASVADATAEEGATSSSQPSSSKSKDRPASKMTPAMISAMLDANPSLKGELFKLPQDQAASLLRNLDLSQLMTGMSLTGKNQKDMASYKFWQTQPVPRFEDLKAADKGKTREVQLDGPITRIDPERVPKLPAPLPEGYEWCELDMTNSEEIKEVYTLLTNHYVEDDNAMFRFDYSAEFLDWALKSPGWKKDWHVGVRASKSRLLVASIFGIPTRLRVRKQHLNVSCIDFLCIHKKLRSKRLAPVLIKEITRRCYLVGIYQAIYTVGTVLPTPIATCRYFHRPLDWLKLYDVGFSPLPTGMTKSRMVSKNKVNDTINTPGWREMQARDVDGVLDLLHRYLTRFALADAFTREEIDHWLLSKVSNQDDRVVWAFVVDDGHGKITDVVSFYCLSSSVIREPGNTKPVKPGHDKVRAAYLYYYASEAAFQEGTSEGDKNYKERLQGLMADALLEAKKANFDVFNALTSQDNPLFLEKLKFGAGDGQLHYYLFNYRTDLIPGGTGKDNMPDEKQRGGVGMLLL